MLDIVPWLVAMAVLITFSAFFSASEAALFSLRPVDRRALAAGSASQKAAALLLTDPERVLSAVLFWNLAVNIAYFAMASIVEHKLPTGSTLVWPLRIGALLIIIFFSEMLPKTFAVLRSRELAASCSLPLTFMVRAVDPIMPTLRLIMLGSRRLFWPNFQSEEILAAADLERAIDLSTNDAKLLDQEQIVLRNIVALSDLRADESMRPRNKIAAFRPPVSVSMLHGATTPSGYVFVMDESENITAAVRLGSLSAFDSEHLDASAEPVVYVPWSASLATTVGLMLAEDREAASVVNEWGESIGVLTMDDIMDVAFTDEPSRSQRLWNRDPIQHVSDGLWLAKGITNLRRLSEYFDAELPDTHRNTLGGVMQEALQRMPQSGDQCRWGSFEFTVLEVDGDGDFSLEIRYAGGTD